MAMESEGGRRKRRHRSEEVKRRITAVGFEPGASVSLVARHHDVNANLLFTWRRRFRSVGEGSAPFVPAVKSNDAPSQVPAPIGFCATAIVG